MFWFCLILGFIGGISILLQQIVIKGYRDIHFWIIGLLILILSRMTLLYLPYVRGYVSWNGDNITHLGLIKDIINDGHFAGDNFYPITHILLSQVISITGIPDIVVSNLATTLLSIIFILSIYLLAKVTLHFRKQQLLAILLAAGVMLLGGGCNVLLNPNGWSILFLPLLYYCYYNRDIISFHILFIIILVLYPFFHPLSSLIVIISLFILALFEWAFPKYLRFRSILVQALDIKNIKVIPLLIEFVIFSPWVLSFQQFNINIKAIWQQITTGIRSDVLGQMGMTLNKINVKGLEFIILLIKIYGVTIIFIILSLVGIYINLRKNFSSDAEKESRNLLSLSFVFLFYGVFYLLYLLGMPALKPLAGQRILAYVEVLTPIFASFALLGVLNKFNFNYLVNGVVICLIILSTMLSIASLYRSPYVIQPNIQITQMDLSGMRFFIENKDVKIGCAYIMSPPYRFIDGILGAVAAKNRGDIYRNVVQLNDHFNYDKCATLGEQYSQDKYAAITQFDRIVYTTVWQTVGRFNDIDFEKLKSDYTVNEFYSNGELNIYDIHSYDTIS